MNRTLNCVRNCAVAGLLTIAWGLTSCGGSSDSLDAGAKAGIEVANEITNPSPQNEVWQISATGLGPVQFGMTIQAVRELLGQDSLFQESNVMVDWDGFALKENGIPLFYILYPHGNPPTDDAPVELLMISDDRYRTPEGIGPGSTLAAAVAVYGEATLSYNVDDEMREYVRFVNAPTHLGFRTTGSPDQWVGRYSAESGNGGYYETQDFDPNGKIQFLLADNSLAPEAPSPTIVSDTGTDTLPAANLDCSNPVTTLEINGCAKQSYEAADRVLNEVYQQVIQGLAASEAAALLTVQQEWLQFRDAHCNQFSQVFVGGSAYPTFLLGCLTRTTEDRIGYLRQALDIFPAENRPPSGLGKVTVDGQILDCNNPVGTPVVKYCAQLAYEQSDRELNEVYQALSTRLDEPEKAALTEAQLTWLEYRDRHCEFATRGSVGATGHEGYRSNCLEDLTRDQTEQLKLQIDR